MRRWKVTSRQVVALALSALPVTAQSKADANRIAKLIAMMADPALRPAAEHELAAIGEPAAHQLVHSLLEHAETETTRHELRLLAAMGPNAGSAAVDLVKGRVCRRRRSTSSC